MIPAVLCCPSTLQDIECSGYPDTSDSFQAPDTESAVPLCLPKMKDEKGGAAT